MSIGLWAQEAIFTHFNCMWTLCGHIELFGTGFVFGLSSPYKEDSARFSSVVSGYLTFTSIPRVDGLSTDPQVLGCHRLVSEPRYTNN